MSHKVAVIIAVLGVLGLSVFLLPPQSFDGNQPVSFVLLSYAPVLAIFGLFFIGSRPKLAGAIFLGASIATVTLVLLFTNFFRIPYLQVYAFLLAALFTATTLLTISGTAFMTADSNTKSTAV